MKLKTRLVLNLDLWISAPHVFLIPDPFYLLSQFVTTPSRLSSIFSEDHMLVENGTLVDDLESRYLGQAGQPKLVLGLTGTRVTPDLHLLRTSAKTLPRVSVEIVNQPYQVSLHDDPGLTGCVWCTASYLAPSRSLL